MIPFPDKKYQIIYADPCWHYGNSNNLGRGNTIAVKDHYQTLETDAIASLPVGDITDDNCLLFMWCCSPLMKDALFVGEKWGFQYITVAFIWNKIQWVVGKYTMSQGELCLLFRRGKIPRPRGKTNIKQWLDSEVVSIRRGKHSEKPKEIRHRITEMFPTQAKIELFARPNWTDSDRGWDFWGDEVNEEFINGTIHT